MTPAAKVLKDSDTSPAIPDHEKLAPVKGSVDAQAHHPAFSSTQMDLSVAATGLTIAGGEEEGGYSDNEEEDSKPFFFPPLWLARRTSCMDVLRREGIRSVVDLGCGPGALLQILSLPANHLDDFPSLYPPSPYSTSPASTVGSHSRSPSTSHLARSRASAHAKVEKLRQVPRLDPADNELHLRRVIGLDINKESLESAIRVSEPRRKKEISIEDEDEDGNAWIGGETERWEPLRVEIWEGSLTTHNEAFDDVECMIATEVIEHLPPASLSKFAPMIFGNYSPRIVIVTTPNHSFNPYFVSSSKEDESLHRFLDPTGRTERVFRDDDHQFEWTEEEFQTWAKDAAEENGYKVSFTGCGSLKHYYGGQKIAFPPPSLDAHSALKDLPTSKALPKDPSTFFATQIAIFRRQYSNEPERSPRSHRTTPLPFFSPGPSPLATVTSATGVTTSPSPETTPSQPSPPSPIFTTTTMTTPITKPLLNRTKSIPNAPHVLLKTHTHHADPAASNPASNEAILRCLEVQFNEYFERNAVGLRDIWNRSDVRRLCGGLIGSVVDAVVDDETGMWDIEVRTSSTNPDLPPPRGDLATEIVWKGWISRVGRLRMLERKKRKREKM